MKTVVIIGGTRGIGRALALRLLRGRDRVTIVGSSPGNGKALAEEATRRGVADRLQVVTGDLDSIASTAAVARDLLTRHDVVDTLVFVTRTFAPQRDETVDGLERTFALSVLSRHLLTKALLNPLGRAGRPVVFGLGGPGGTAGRIHWDDLHLLTGYSGREAALQSARAIDLLGAGFHDRYPASPVRYVLHSPGRVDTGRADRFANPTRFAARAVIALVAVPVDRAVETIVVRMAAPSKPFAAYRGWTDVDVTRPEFNRTTAARFYAVLDGLTGAGRT